MITRIKNGRLILPDGIKEGKNLYISDDRILAISETELPCDNELDAENNYVSPGFIDIHIHGGGGSDFMDGGTEPIVSACALHLKHGTTSLLPTTLACSWETLYDFLDDLKKVMDNNLSDCRVLGAHLEGPYFAKSQRGAQPLDYIKTPCSDDYEKITAKYGDIIKRWSFAPELEGSLDFVIIL